MTELCEINEHVQLEELLGKRPENVELAGEIPQNSNVNRRNDFKIAEELFSGDGETGPRAAMSLGLSSMAMHVPFASPASMPSPMPDGQGDYSRSAHSVYGAPQSLDLSKRNGYTSTGFSFSEFQRQDQHLSISEDSDMRDPRTALFGMPTPGMSPGADINPRASAILDDYGIRTLLGARSVTNTPGSALDGVPKPPSSRMPNSVHSAASSTNGLDANVMMHMYGTGTSGRHNSTSGQNNRNTRVSFGATTRLSFSGMMDYSGDGGLSGIAEGVSQLYSVEAGEEPEDGLIEESTDNDDTLADAVDTSNSLEDEHPFKLQRKSDDGFDLADPSSIMNQPLGPYNTRQSSRIAQRKSMSPFPLESMSPIFQTKRHQGLSTSSSHKYSSNNAEPSGPLAKIAKAGKPISKPTAESSNVKSTKIEKEASCTISVINSENLAPNSNSVREVPPTSSGDTDKTKGTEPVNRSNKDVESLQIGLGMVHEVVSIFCSAYYFLCQYRCRECIKTLQLLPKKHIQCGFANQLIGRAYYESNEYKPAVLAFREMMRVEPFRVSGLETFSTAMWHLKTDKELCALSQRVSKKLSTVGNYLLDFD